MLTVLYFHLSDRENSLFQVFNDEHLEYAYRLPKATFHGFYAEDVRLTLSGHVYEYPIVLIPLKLQIHE